MSTGIYHQYHLLSIYFNVHQSFWVMGTLWYLSVLHVLGVLCGKGVVLFRLTFFYELNFVYCFCHNGAVLHFFGGYCIILLYFDVHKLYLALTMKSFLNFTQSGVAGTPERSCARLVVLMVCSGLTAKQN